MHRKSGIFLRPTNSAAMNILDRYIALALIKTTLSVLLSLLLILLFFTLIDELGTAKKADYSLWHALHYTFIATPKLATELFPIASVIGSMGTLSLLAKNNELVIIRTSGISKPRLAWALAKGGIVLICISLLINEILTPYTEKNTQRLRSLTEKNQDSLITRHGFWAKEAQTFINVRQILSNDHFTNVHIYELNNQQQLLNNSVVKRAKYKDGQWQLENIKRTEISKQKISTETIASKDWKVSLNPNITDLIINPKFISVTKLYDYINYLQNNGQNSKIYEQAFWSKIMSPLFIIIMVLIAVPIVRSYSKNPFDQRIYLGCLAGIGLHILTQTIIHIGNIYTINPMLSVSLPILLTLTVLIGLLYKQA